MDLTAVDDNSELLSIWIDPALLLTSRKTNAMI